MDVVTGALGFTGRYIAERLLAQGRAVTTLTGHPGRPNPFGPRLRLAPLDFTDYPQLVANLHGVDTLYNTYWVRFPRGGTTFEAAVANTQALLRAAVEAGARRLVHLSIANPSLSSPLPYYRGKAAVEAAIAASGLSYAILRPTVIFGPGDILMNNIAWLLRRFPVFAVPGRGDYRVQPVYVADVAELAMSLAGDEENVIVDAVGPEVYTYNELVHLVATAVHSRALVVHLPSRLVALLARVIGLMVGDVLLTPDELDGLLASLLVSTGVPTGKTRLSDWLARNAQRVGVAYASELHRHYR